MGCEAGMACQQRACFRVELLSSTAGAASRNACGVHLSAAVTWAHEIAALRLAVHPEAAPTAVTVTPIPDVDHGVLADAEPSPDAEAPARSLRTTKTSGSSSNSRCSPQQRPPDARSRDSSPGRSERSTIRATSLPPAARLSPG